MTSPRLDDIRAEAASWLARLRREGRDARDEAAFQAWVAQSEDHRAAFDAVTATFELAGALRDERPARRAHVAVDRRAVLAGVGAIAAVGVGWFALAPAVYATGIGETRTVNLDDGSSILLDADSRVRVSLRGDRRRVQLVKGRAFFRAAADPTRPFVVSAGDQQVVSDGGDAFDVKLRDKAVFLVPVKGEVTLMEAGQPSNRLKVLPGQRLVAMPGVNARREAADVQTATSWRFGQAVFDNQTLAEALGEMNRYSRRRIELSDPSMETLRISGVYKTGDNEAFARSAAVLLNLRVRDAGGALIMESAGG